VEGATTDGIRARGLRDKSVHTGSCGSSYDECGDAMVLQQDVHGTALQATAQYTNCSQEHHQL